MAGKPPDEEGFRASCPAAGGLGLAVGGSVVVPRSAEIGPQGQVILRSGTYPITVEFFQARGAQGLEVSYEGPGIAKQLIPASVLVRQPGG